MAPLEQTQCQFDGGRLSGRQMPEFRLLQRDSIRSKSRFPAVEVSPNVDRCDAESRSAIAAVNRRELAREESTL
jgi:hypothetical protein